jgi:hypothetical protein
VAGETHLVVGPPEAPSSAEKPNRIMFGVGLAVVKFRQAVDWRRWIETFIPEAERQRQGDTVYYALPVIPFLGPQRPYVLARDDRTLWIVHDRQRLDGLLAGEPPGVSAGNKDWRSVEGGLFAATASDREVKPAAADPTDSQSAAWRQLFTGADRFALAWDVSPSFDQFELWLRFHCADRPSAEKVSGAIPSIFAAAKAEAEKSVANASRAPSQTEIELHEFYIRLLDSCSVQTVENAYASVDVAVTVAARFPDKAFADALPALLGDDSPD